MGRAGTGEAERALEALPAQRQEAMRMELRGEDAELPDGSGLQAVVAEAKERCSTFSCDTAYSSSPAALSASSHEK